MDELFNAVRAACSPSTWSKAVELVRRLAVSGQSEQDDELICHVKLPTRALPHAVQLYEQDAEWACDCESKAACCEHVAAAVIAVKQARARGEALPRGGAHEARLVHRFKPERGELSLERVLVQHDGQEQVLTTSLAHAVATQSAGVSLSPSQADLNVDRVLGQRGPGPLPPDTAVAVIKLLSGARNVEFDGRPVHVATEQLLPVAHIRDANPGFEVHLAADPRLSSVVASGVGLAGDTLHLLGELRSAGPKWEALPNAKQYRPEATATLVLEVLPELLKRIKVNIETKNLPELTRDAKPRAVIKVEQEGDKLSALLTLVYGDPPLARIDAGRLVHLRGPIPLRDEAQEQRVAARAKEELGLSVGQRVSVVGEAAVALALRLSSWSGDVQSAHPGRPLSKANLVSRAELVPTLRHDHGALDLRFDSAADGQTATAEAVLRAFNERQSLVPLLGGGFAPLPHAWLNENIHLLRALVEARALAKPDTPEGPAHLKPALAELCQVLDYPTPPSLEPFKRLLRGTDELPAAQLPSDLTAELRPYQRQGVDWLSLLQSVGMGALLADDMGLGKTLQTLCVLSGKCLVVCPTSVVHNWVGELQKFRPGLSYCVYHGKSRKLERDAQVVITSYALLRLDEEVLTAQEFDTVVLDEAQLIKNPQSQVAQAAYRIRARFRIALSGTPVENRLQELWSLFHFTNPGLLGGRQEFQVRYAEPIRLGDAGAAKQLRQRVAPFILRRDKSTVASDLPPRTDLVLHCELSEPERALYSALHAAAQSEVVEQLQVGGGVMRALEALLRLRQAACHPALIPGSKQLPLPTEDPTSGDTPADPDNAEKPALSAKFSVLLDRLEQVVAEGHKALVFSQWTSLLDLLEPALGASHIRYARLDGSTRDRSGVVERFQEDPSVSVLLVSLKAGGVGLNLTAADHVFLMDPWWNPAVERQATDRAHRIGQLRPVFVHRLVARDTVEEKILALQDTKRALAAAALEDAEAAASLGRDELLELLA